MSKFSAYNVVENVVNQLEETNNMLKEFGYEEGDYLNKFADEIIEDVQNYLDNSPKTEDNAHAIKAKQAIKKFGTFKERIDSNSRALDSYYAHKDAIEDALDSIDLDGYNLDSYDDYDYEY